MLVRNELGKELGFGNSLRSMGTEFYFKVLMVMRIQVLASKLELWFRTEVVIGLWSAVYG